MTLTQTQHRVDDDELRSVDFPIGTRQSHPGKSRVRQWVDDCVDEYKEADGKSSRELPDGLVLRSKAQIISDILDTIQDAGGTIKRKQKNGRWRPATRADARQRIAEAFKRAIKKTKQQQQQQEIDCDSNINSPKRQQRQSPSCTANVDSNIGAETDDTKAMRPRSQDVIFGKCDLKLRRGNPGNLLFEHLVAQNFAAYQKADALSDYLDKGLKRDKKIIRQEILALVKNSGGRFLVNKRGTWEAMSDTEATMRIVTAFASLRKSNKHHHQKELQRSHLPGCEDITCVEDVVIPNVTIPVPENEAAEGESDPGCWSLSFDLESGASFLEGPEMFSPGGHDDSRQCDATGTKDNQNLSLSCSESLDRMRTSNSLEGCYETMDLGSSHGDAGIMGSLATFSRESESLATKLAESVPSSNPACPGSRSSVDKPRLCFLEGMTFDGLSSLTKSHSHGTQETQRGHFATEPKLSITVLNRRFHEAMSEISSVTSGSKPPASSKKWGQQCNKLKNEESIGGPMIGDPTERASEVSSLATSNRSWTPIHRIRGCGEPMPCTELVGFTVALKVVDDNSAVSTTWTTKQSSIEEHIWQTLQTTDRHDCDINTRLRCIGDVAHCVWEDVERVARQEKLVLAILESLMENFTEDVRLAENAGRLITALCDRESNPLLPSRYAALLRTLEVRSSNVQAQALGLSALADMSTGTLNRESIADAGGIPFVLTAMKVHRHHTRIQESGCSVLSHLAEDFRFQSMIVGSKGINCVLEAMEQHQAQVLVQKNALSVLDQLAEERNYRQLIRNADGVMIMILVMHQNLANAQIQETCCSVLGQLAAEEGSFRGALAVRGLAAVMAAMQRHPTNFQVQRNARMALCSATFQPIFRQMILNAASIVVHSFKVTVGQQSVLVSNDTACHSNL